MSERQEVQLDGRLLSVSNLDKVLYPETGFTKGEVLDYYVRIAPVMLEHLRGRPVTFRRFPDGVETKGFYAKHCPSHRPDWLATAHVADQGDKGVDYCVLEEPAALGWVANLAALELHTPMGRIPSIEQPSQLVFDLDPGAPAGMGECAQVALALRDLLGEQGAGLELFAKTSGSKGLQVYVPINQPCTYDETRAVSLAAAERVGATLEGLVVTKMTRAIRKGKVLVDWTQNHVHKTTVCAYSLRAKARPTVSTPVGWDEVAEAAEGAELSFEASEVLERVEASGDLFAEVATLRQQLPDPDDLTQA